MGREKRLEPSDAMLDHTKSIQVWHDDEQQQAMTCVVHGFAHDREDIRSLSMMLSGVDVVEGFSPARVVNFCDKYGGDRW